MDIELRSQCSEAEWEIVARTLEEVGMAHHEPHVHREAFKNSYTSVFAYHIGELVGFGRAISDGAYQAAVYDVAVRPDFQRNGIGRKIVETIMSRLTSCNVILYAFPGKEAFYQKLGFCRMRTGMALFRNTEVMRLKGFVD